MASLGWHLKFVFSSQRIKSVKPKRDFSPGSVTSETEIDKSFLLACSLNEGKNIALYWQIQYCNASRDSTLREKHMDGIGQVFIGILERTIGN